MAAIPIESEAFRRAELRSERVRILGLLSGFGAILLFVLIRMPFLTRPGERWSAGGSVLLLVAFIAFEAAMLHRLRPLLEEDVGLQGWGWRAGLIFETLLPTVAILLLTIGSDVGPYRSLAAPALVGYFLLIVLSTLRLSPLQSHLVGLASALGHLSLVAFTFLRYPEHPARGVVPLAFFLTYGVLLWIAGLVAAGVAGQIRGHVAVALREAREVERVRRDLEVARSIQQGLLPKEPPELAGFEVAGWNQPADQTGGDYYYWQTLPDGRVAFSLADVTGHGIGPSLVTATCRAYTRASLPGLEQLGQTMTRINGLLAEDLPRGKLVQLVVAIVDPVSRRIEMLSAGHGPLLVVRGAAAKVEHLDAHGIPLGVTTAIDYGAPQPLELEVGDLLILLTDGFFEWEDATGEQFGFERLDRVLLESRELPAREIIERMHQAVLDFSGGTSQDDDLTAVVIQRRDAS